MARIFTQAQMIASVRDQADLNTGPSGFITDGQIASTLNEGISALWGKLVDACEDYYLKVSPPVSLLVGQTTYALPWDAWKGRGIDVSTDANFVNDVNTARPFNWKQRNMYNSAMGVYSFLGSTNIRYKFLPGTPLTIKFIPPNAPGNLLAQVWYLPQAPIVIGSPLAAWAANTTVALNQLATYTVAGVGQVFAAMNAGETGSSAPSFVVPGLTTDNAVTWAYVGPASLYIPYFDGFNGWEEYPIVYASLVYKDKMEGDVSTLAARLSKLDERIASEIRNTDDDEPDFIVDSYYQDGGNGGGDTFGGGWFG